MVTLKKRKLHTREKFVLATETSQIQQSAMPVWWMLVTFIFVDWRKLLQSYFHEVMKCRASQSNLWNKFVVNIYSFGQRPFKRPKAFSTTILPELR